jgi:ubiquinone/menaquinone biosynthesis C-methylase UbiE
MGDRYREQWEALGRTDPYWAVLSHPEKKGGRWDRSEFFATGEAEIAAVLARLDALGVRPQFGTALDFGCGVGRLCRALASRFERVVGVDVSEAMLDEARAVNQDFTNIEFIHNEGVTLADVPDRSIDLLYSNLVLQHMPRAQQLSYIADFGRVVRPGGVLVFQTPSRHDLGTFKGWLHRLAGNRGVNLIRRLRHGPDGVMELHCLRRREIMVTLDGLDMEVLDVARNTEAGRSFVSYRYIAVVPEKES